MNMSHNDFDSFNGTCITILQSSFKSGVKSVVKQWFVSHCVFTYFSINKPKVV